MLVEMQTVQATAQPNWRRFCLPSANCGRGSMVLNVLLVIAVITLAVLMTQYRNQQEEGKGRERSSPAPAPAWILSDSQISHVLDLMDTSGQLLRSCCNW